jgi:acetylornithine deacetylase/succinyl-diaminopimelate desuccinylase-like protein
VIPGERRPAAREGFSLAFRTGYAGACCAGHSLLQSALSAGAFMKNRLAAMALMAALPASAADLPKVDAARFDVWRAAHEMRIVDQLDELVRFKSVAADPAGLKAMAAHLQGLLTARGFDATLLTDQDHAPVVLGELQRPGAKRTVVFYAHYDGQPVTPSEWKSDPFVPVMRTGIDGDYVDWKVARTPFNPEWRLFGRAAADDKSSITAFLMGFDALKASGRKPSVNIKVVWEGEEEAGSAHLAAILGPHAAALKSDLWLIGDGPVHQSRTRTLYFGARGTTGFEATVYGPLRALHDGHYGNWAPNPAAMAAEFITTLRDGDGRILIPGFYDDVRPLNAAETAAIAHLPPVEAGLKQQFGLATSEGREGLTASTMRPALNIRGLRSGQVGAEAAGAIPVDAVISMDYRIVPGQTPARVKQQTEAFLAAKGWTIVHDAPDLATRLAHPRLVLLRWGGGYPALRSDMTSPEAQAAIRAAGGGSPVTLLPMMGASVPIYLFDDMFHVPVIGLPVTNHDNNQHAANENLRLQNLWDAVDLYARMMSALTW